MKISNLKLFILLDSFSDKDIKEFRKLVTSNFFSNGRNYVHVFNKIVKLRKKGLENLTPHMLHSKIYPGKKFSMQTLNNRFSELFKLGEEFLVQRTLKENKPEKDRLLLIAYHRNKSKKLFRSRLDVSKKDAASLPESDSKYLLDSFLDKLDISFSKDPVISENTYNRYFENSQNVAALFLKNLYDFGFEFLQQEQTDRRFDFNLVVEILNRLKIDDPLIRKLLKNEKKIFKIAALEYYFYDIFKNPDNEKNFYEARKIFEEMKFSLEESYRTEAFKKMTNYCILRQNQGVKTFNGELFKLYNEILKQNIYLDHKNEFPQTTFRNYVLIGIILKKKNWTEKFIKKYSVHLPGDIRDDEVNLSYSKLFFSERDYERSLQYISGIKGLNYLHYSDSAILKLCTFYETGKYEEAFSEMDKFRHYIRNHREIPRIHKEYALNFLRIYKMLLKIMTGTDSRDLILIESTMNKLIHKSREAWLTEKLTELKKKNKEAS